MATIRGTRANYDCEGSITQYHFVKMNAANKVEECDSEGEAPDGIALEAGTDEGRIDVFTGPGPCKVAAGDVVTLNGFIQVDSDGEAIDAATTGHYIVGKALQASTAADEIIEIDFFGRGYLTQVGD
jgi:hypothetical protein